MMANSDSESGSTNCAWQLLPCSRAFKMKFAGQEFQVVPVRRTILLSVRIACNAAHKQSAWLRLQCTSGSLSHRSMVLQLHSCFGPECRGVGQAGFPDKCYERCLFSMIMMIVFRTWITYTDTCSVLMCSFQLWSCADRISLQRAHIRANMCTFQSLSCSNLLKSALHMLLLK